MTQQAESSEQMEQSLIDIAVESWRFSRLFGKVVSKLDAGESGRYVNQLRYFQKKVEDWHWWYRTRRDILDSLVGDPVFEAISMGHPERMGLAHGWDVDTFLARSQTRTPGGLPYQNLCIGCDRFHEEVLGPRLLQLREQRQAARQRARDSAR